jgi:tetratricopeptide (TPR) repeat protein
MARAPEASSSVRESLAIARELGNRERVAAALVLLGTLLGNQGDLAPARACFEEALALSEQLGNVHRTASALGSLAVLHGREGNLDHADALFERSLALSRTQGNTNTIAANLCNLAVVATRRGTVQRARAFLAEALDLAEAMEARSLGLAVLSIAILVEATGGNFERAAFCHGAWLAECERQGSDVDLDQDLQAPLVARARATLGDDRFDEAAREGQRLDYAAALRALREWLVAG